MSTEIPSSHAPSSTEATIAPPPAATAVAPALTYRNKKQAETKARDAEKSRSGVGKLMALGQTLDAAEKATKQQQARAATEQPANTTTPKTLRPPRIRNQSNAEYQRERREKRDDLTEDVDESIAYIQGMAEDLAERHKKPVDFFLQKFQLRGVEIGKGRQPQAWNAWLQKTAQDMGADGATKEQITAAAKGTYKKASSTEIEEALDALVTSREIKNSLPNPNRKSRAQDVRQTTQDITKELGMLKQRTKANYLLFVVPGDSCEGQGMLAATDVGREVMGNACKMEPEQMLRRLENYSLSGIRNTGGDAPTLKRRLTDTILDAFRMIIGRENARMFYKDFESRVVDEYGVHIVGWPEDIKFKEPSSLTLPELQRLLTAWLSGTCRFERMPGGARKGKKTSKNGADVPAQQKSQGKKRKSAKNVGSDSEEGNVAKRARQAEPLSSDVNSSLGSA